MTNPIPTFLNRTRLALGWRTAVAVLLTASCGQTENGGIVGPTPTGALQVEVSGLPVGVAGRLIVTGPNHVDTVTASGVLQGLQPGQYQVAALDIDANSGPLLPNPTSQTVAVPSGGTVQVHVAYTPGAARLGGLTIAIDGLPTGALAAVGVSGPDGFDRSLTSSMSADVAAGEYRIAANPVQIDGVTYTADPVSQTVAIAPAESRIGAVHYRRAAQTTGSLALTVGGLPSGVTASITVTAPDGGVQLLTGSAQLDRLAPGSYTLAAAEVVVEGLHHYPTPASQAVTVTAGSVVAASITFATATPSTGTLTVHADGLGGSAVASIAVAGPNGYARLLNATTVIDGLAPGSYTVNAVAVQLNGVGYAPSPATQVVTVTAGTTTGATVTYTAASPTTGQLTVTVSGVPAPAAAAVTVTGPDGFSRSVPSTTTISGLTPGNYTIAATAVVLTGTTYQPTPASQVIAVTAGSIGAGTVTYATVAPSTGALTVTVSGLPGGALAAVTVTGPNSYRHTVTATETITALPIGTYTIAAATVTSGGTSYTASPTSQSAAVTANTTTTRSIAYSAPAAAATVAVDTTVRFQQMAGWEATAQAGQATAQFAGYQTELMNLAGGDLGINRLRLEITSGAENTVDYYAQYRAGTITTAQYNAQRYAWVNDNADASSINAAGFQWSKLDESIESTVLPMRSQLAARGEALYVNLNYVSFGGSTAQQAPAEYAELILATFQHIQSRYGFVPNAVEVILEPDNNTIRTGTGIGQLITATGARLAAAGFHPDFIAPSVMNMSNAVSYIDQIVAVAGATTYLTDMAYHRYSGVSDATLSAIQSRAAQLGIRTAMLEHIGSGVEDLYKDLTLANVSAWQQYTLAFPTIDNGAQYYYISGGRPVMGNLTHALRQYFQYVRAGAYRVRATSQSSGVRPVAFTNPGASMAVVLHVDAPGSYTVSGLRPGSYQVEMTNASGTLIAMPGVTAVAGGSVTVAPSQTGVLTLYRAP